MTARPVSAEQDHIERKPCPRHPDQGDITWMPVFDRRRPDVIEHIPACVPCAAGSKPYERPEFAS